MKASLSPVSDTAAVAPFVGSAVRGGPFPSLPRETQAPETPGPHVGGWAGPWPDFIGPEKSGSANRIRFAATKAGIVVIRVPTGRGAALQGGGPQLQPVPWQERDVLERVGSRLPFAPRLVGATDEAIVYHMLPGSPWPAKQAPGTRWAAWVGRAIGMIGSVRAADLPDVPADWPAEGDSTAYAQHFLDHMAEVVRYRRQLHGDLFDAFGYPADPTEALRESAAALAPRASGLQHGDLHIGNFLVGPLGIVDWGLATLGDPASDLAMHLQLVPYTPAEEAAAVDGWLSTVSATTGRTALRDLPVWHGIHALRFSLATLSGTAEQLRQAQLLGPAKVHEVIEQRTPRVLRRVNRAIQAWNAPRPLQQAEVVDILKTFAASSPVSPAVTRVLQAIPSAPVREAGTPSRKPSLSPSQQRDFARFVAQNKNAPKLGLGKSRGVVPQ